MFTRAADATFKNIIIGKNSVINVQMDNPNGDIRSGVLVGNVGANCRFENIYIAATMNGQRYTGGVAGFIDVHKTDKIFVNCTFAGTIVAAVGNCTAGGIIGHCGQGNVIVANCRNIGSITTNGNAGVHSAASGIIARNYCTGVQIYNCINNGPVTGLTAAGACLGGMQLVDQTMVNCINYGAVTVVQPQLDTFSESADYFDYAQDAEGNSNNVFYGVVMHQPTYERYAPAAGETEIRMLLTNCENKAGETDPTVAAATLNLDSVTMPTKADIDAQLADELANLIPVLTGQTTGGDNTQGGNTDNSQGGNNDNTQGGNDTTTTTAPADNNETDAPNASTPDNSTPTTEEKKGGCGGAVSGVLLIGLITAGAALTVCKKKED